MKTRFVAFLTEQHPFVVRFVREAIDKAFAGLKPGTDLGTFGKRLGDVIAKAVQPIGPSNFETTPFVSAKERSQQEVASLLDAINGFFAREEIAASFTKAEKIRMLRGIILTRAADLTLKKIFLSSEIKYQEVAFQGKGFRSLGQEAIYAAALRLKKGDIVAPLIRDLGVALAMSGDDVENAINGQAGKEGLPTDGRDLHIGDYKKGVWPPAAPLAISTCSAVGLAAAFKLRKEKRVSVSFIGEGGTSLGEWHEAINFAAARGLPVVFCVENNQTALSTARSQQSAVRLFGDKAKGYGIPHVTLDGTDPEAIAAAFAWAAQRARDGLGPSLIELVCMRMCGHAHHDDMLYLGHEPSSHNFEYPTPTKGGYVDAPKYALWSQKDPIKVYAAKLIKEKVCTQKQVDQWIADAKSTCEAALEKVKAAPWPSPKADTNHAFVWPSKTGTLAIESAPAFDKQGATYMEAISQAAYEGMRADKSVFMLGEDVEPPYGNAFMMFKNAPKELWPRFINTPISENAIVGALVGMAAEGMKPIGEMQFNDFAASAFDQIVNNAAKLRYRTGIAAPFVLRMPWGGLRRAGPYHSQDTIPWFHRAFGLKIVAPSTPHDARALLHAALEEKDDPVLFYEHIALYRDPSIKQVLGQQVESLPLGKAALRRMGADLTLVSYGAFVHRACAVADKLSSEYGISCDVIDLRSLVPLDYNLLGASIVKTGKVLLVGEDSRSGSILESLASKISEGLYSHLDAPVKVIGSLDTPIPYSPSLEDAYLPSNEFIFNTAITLARF